QALADGLEKARRNRQVKGPDAAAALAEPAHQFWPAILAEHIEPQVVDLRHQSRQAVLVDRHVDMGPYRGSQLMAKGLGRMRRTAQADDARLGGHLASEQALV